MANDTRSFSARFTTEVLERLSRRSLEAGTNRSRLAERYVDEGTRMDDHPGVVFHDGPTGRRAALVGGPDVWEVMATIRTSGARGEESVGVAAEALDLAHAQVRAAVRYYGAFPAEIEDRIRRNVEEADAAEAAWRREQAALS